MPSDPYLEDAADHEARWIRGLFWWIALIALGCWIDVEALPAIVRALHY